MLTCRLLYLFIHYMPGNMSHPSKFNILKLVVKIVPGAPH